MKVRDRLVVIDFAGRFGNSYACRLLQRVTFPRFFKYPVADGIVNADGDEYV